MKWILNRSSSFSIVIAMLLVPFAVGCGLFGDDDNGGERLSLSQLETELSGPTRVEIDLRDGGLIAREVTVDHDDADDDDDEEEIESELASINPQNGTLELVLGNLTISYTDQTRFETDNDSNVSRSEWEQAVALALDNGRVFIEAQRSRPSSPQAPGDASFVATELRIDDDIDHPSIDIYVDAAGLQRVDNPPPLAMLRVLGLDVQITDDTRLRLDED